MTRPTARVWLLLLLLVVVAGSTTLPSQRESVPHFASHDVPEVVAPTGRLAEVFEGARPGTLRIEVRNWRNLTLGVGTGFFISPDGLVLTAYHVVKGQGRLVGVNPHGVEHDLELVGFDAYLDLALLQADVSGSVDFVPLATSAPLPDSNVVAIGNSRGDFLQGRVGQVTRLGVEAVRADFASGTIELTAALSPGDSGGPVLNDNGEAVGVVSYISFLPEGTPTGGERFVPPFLRGLVLPNAFASYAVPVLEGGEVVMGLLMGTQRDVPVIGFYGGGDYLPRAGGLDLGPRAGAIVSQVAPGGPAEGAGLRSLQERPLRDAQGQVVGREVLADVIVEVDGRPTRRFYDLLELVRQKNIGDTVMLTVQRGQETVMLKLELSGERSVFRR